MISEMHSASFYNSKSKELLNGKTLASLATSNRKFADIFQTEGGTWWIHCTDPTDSEIKALSKALHLHPVTCDQLLQGKVKEKFEQFDGYFFVAYSLSSTGRFYVVVTDQGIVTLQRNAECNYSPLLLDRLQTLQSNLSSGAVTPQWICHAFIDFLTDSFGPQISQVEQEAGYIEKELFLHNGQSDVKSLLPRMCSARVQSVELMNLFQDKPSVIKSLLAHCGKLEKKTFTSDLLLTAAQGHLNAMIESTYALESMIARSFINYISIMRVKMVHSNSSMEQIVGVVALVGLVLVPSHVITAAWAMNVPSPGDHYQGQGIFWGVVATISFCTIVASIFAIWYFRKVVKHASTNCLVTPK